MDDVDAAGDDQNDAEPVRTGWQIAPDDEADAQSHRDDLMTLAEDIAEYYSDHRPDRPYSLFAPDQVVYMQSLSQRGNWIVGLDVHFGQGNHAGMYASLRELQQDTDYVVKALQKRSDERSKKLLQRLREFSAHIHDTKVRFYDAVKFETTYDIAILPRTKDASSQTQKLGSASCAPKSAWTSQQLPPNISKT